MSLFFLKKRSQSRGLQTLSHLVIILSVFFSLLSFQTLKEFFWIFFIAFSLPRNISPANSLSSSHKNTSRPKLSLPCPSANDQPFGHSGPPRHHQSLLSLNKGSVLNQLPRKPSFFLIGSILSKPTTAPVVDIQSHHWPLSSPWRPHQPSIMSSCQNHCLRSHPSLDLIKIPQNHHYCRHAQ